MTDRRYGTGNKYGNGRLYGASDIPIISDRFQWAVDVAWNGVYSGANEAQYMTSLYMFRGRRSFINPNGQGFAPVETGRLDITLDNYDGRYDAWNSSSLLYPNVAPGCNIRVRIKDLTTGTIYSVFTGVVVDIQTIGYGTNAKVILVCEDYWNYLRNTNARQGFNFSLSLDTIILHAITSLVWTYGYAFETSTDVVPVWWTGNNMLVGDMISNIADSFFGKFFIAANGKAKFYDRASTRTSVATYTQSQMLKDIGNSQPWMNQRNTLRIKLHPRAAATNQIVWSLNTPLFIAAHASVSMFSDFFYNFAQVPVNGPQSNRFADWHANTASNGSGTDLTNSFAISTSSSYGDTIFWEMVNNGTLDGYLTDLNWVGTPYYETGSMNAVYPTSPPDNRREFVIDSLWQQDITLANTLVNKYGPQIATVRQFPVVAYDTRVESLVPDLFDIVTVGIAKLGINPTDFEVGGIEIETKEETCQSFIVRHYLEPHFT